MSQSGGPRIISKFVEGVIAVFDADGDPKYSLSAGTNHTGWTLADATNGIIQWQGYIDLSGYRPDDMVLSPRAVQVQYGANWFSTAGAGTPGGSTHIQMAITTDKIDDIDFGAAGVAEPLAGFIGDNSEMDQVIYGCSELWAPTASGVGQANMQRMEYGDGVPIVGPRVYLTIRGQFLPYYAVTRTLVSTNNLSANCTFTENTSARTAIDTSFYIPPMRFVIAGEAGEVPEYQLLHLMKRQVDLQQTPDVDV
tara:strand:+ start:742 stop:1497 length:756 start_codon:yes stop_codon:yes gene_type:complete